MRMKPPRIQASRGLSFEENLGVQDNDSLSRTGKIRGAVGAEQAVKVRS